MALESVTIRISKLASSTGALMQQPYGVEELSLIDAIHAMPRNDEPRLAYADWLEAQGSCEYAEFIRLQCERPYVAIRTRGQPTASLSHEFPWEEEAAKHRLKRLLSLYPLILQSERLSAFRQDYYSQEFVRGLALWEINEVDRMPNPPQLVRFRAIVEVEQGHLAGWQNLPIVQRVDVLRLTVHKKSEDQEPIPDLSHVDFSFFQRLEELNLGGVYSHLRDVLASKVRTADVRITDDH